MKEPEVHRPSDLLLLSLSFPTLTKDPWIVGEPGSTLLPDRNQLMACGIFEEKPSELTAVGDALMLPEKSAK